MQSGNFESGKAVSTRTVQSMFDKRVRTRPHAPAVYRPDGDCWSYARLNSFANRVAHLLLARGLKPEQPVGVCMQRSPETVGILLGILKARGTYVPLDVNMPAERLRYISADAMFSEIFADDAGAAKLRDAALNSVEVLSSSISEEWPDESPALAGSEQDLLALLYTSGSTGKPKGVMLEHAAALRLVIDTKWLTFSADDVFLQASALSFDLSTFEIWGPLLNGGSLVAAPPSPSIAELEYLLDAFGVTTLWLTSGLFNVVMEERPAAIRNLKYLLTGGDVVSPRHARIALRHLTHGQLMNCYGPTENATFSTSHRVRRSDTEQASLPIGLPVDKSPVYLLDGSLKPVCDLQVGEIFVGGEGLSRGYWNRPELNEQKFISVEVEPELSMRLYRTGDLGRYNSAGLLEFVGRTDFQVKIRGFRVEPEEIELALCKMRGVASAAVITSGSSAESKALCCSYVQDGSALVTPESIKAYLKKMFPDYMVPTFYRELNELPRNTNDKVDRKVLDSLFSGGGELSAPMFNGLPPLLSESVRPAAVEANGERIDPQMTSHLGGTTWHKLASFLGFHVGKRVLSTASHTR
jgi:amino acid adenylation domain-containing protein